MGSHNVAQLDLEVAMLLRLASSQQWSCFSLWALNLQTCTTRPGFYFLLLFLFMALHLPLSLHAHTVFEVTT